MIKYRPLIVLLSLAVASVGAASEAYDVVYHPEMTVGKSSGEIVLDGRIDDAGWAAAGRADTFAEHNPGDQTRPPVDTYALMTYDDDNLYVAWVCYDDPSLVRATMTERDRIWQDDYVILTLDPYGDQVWAYEIAANPYGIQGDLFWSSNGGEDMGYDLVFETGAAINGESWIVEMKIPFSSLRFPSDDVNEWRVDFWRNHPREVRGQYSWAAYDRNDNCWPCNWGTVKGIDGVEPGSGFELLPSLVATQSGGRVRDADGVPTADWDNGDINDGDILDGLSLGAKYAVSSDFTLEGTYNPDFSQVEADAAQIDVNSTFALHFPERRPFFQEGSDMFQTWFNAVYTRSINDPSFAAKVTGRPGRTNVAYLVARDEHTPIILPFEEGNEFVQGGKSVSNILRVRHSLGDLSHVGVITTDRHLDDGGSGKVMGADARVRFTDNALIEMQVLTSLTGEPDDPLATADFDTVTFDSGKHTAAFDGETYWGHALYTSIEYGDSKWDLDADYWERSPTFRADSGFEPSNSNREVVLSGGRVVRFDDSTWLNWINTRMNMGNKWNFDGIKKDEWVYGQVAMRLKKMQTYVQVDHMRSAEKFRDDQYDDIYSTGFHIQAIPTGWLNFGVNASKGHRIARFARTLGDEEQFSAWATLKPFDRLVVDANYDRANSIDIETGEELFDGYILRTRVQFQLSRELAARVVLQYNDFRGSWDADPLLTYRLNPFSIFYVGSTRDYRDLSMVENGIEGWTLTDRQYFMKLQYLFQI